MALLPGVYTCKKKNASIYYRASINYKNKHISLGSFDTEKDAHTAYIQAKKIIEDNSYDILNYSSHKLLLSFEKYVILVNFRDNNMYFKTPIYLYKSFFMYYYSTSICYKFDVDDLFYYANHKIMKRGNHLFVSDYGMQVNILSRYGIKNFAVIGKDYIFKNGDTNDYRYSNIEIINKYIGVSKQNELYVTKIHINGNIMVGAYSSEITAAIAYNKAADILNSNGLQKNFARNYILEITENEYTNLYSKIHINRKIKDMIDFKKTP